MLVIAAPVAHRASEAELQARVWSVQNAAAAAWGSKHPLTYRRLRIEDFNGTCAPCVHAYHAFVAAAFAAGHPPDHAADAARVPTEEAVAAAMAGLQSRPLGSHDRDFQAPQPPARRPPSATKALAAPAPGGLRGQYGKWHALATSAEQAALTDIAGPALRAFGYLG
jgi:hypothetical protein